MEVRGSGRSPVMLAIVGKSWGAHGDVRQELL